MAKIGISRKISQNISEYPGATLTYFTGLVGVLVEMIFQIFVLRSPKEHFYGNQLNIGDVCVSSVTRGHKYKLYKQSCSKSVRRQFFVNRVINVWNNLPQDTDFSSFNLFKCAIENNHLSQYLKYDK